MGLKRGSKLTLGTLGDVREFGIFVDFFFLTYLFVLILILCL